LQAFSDNRLDVIAVWMALGEWWLLAAAVGMWYVTKNCLPPIPPKAVDNRPGQVSDNQAARVHPTEEVKNNTTGATQQGESP
jgi:hypothetical protein